MKIEFIKCHGSGNDFVLIDGIGERECLNTDIPDNGIAGLDDNDLKSFTRLICDRKGPVGADGVLLLLPSAVADVRMRMFNPDGSEAEMCGNGIRCAARLAVEIIGRRSVNHPAADSDSGECSISKDNGACHNSRRDNDVCHDTERDSVRIETAKAVLECRREDDIYPGVESYSVLIDNVSLTSDSFACAEQKPFIDSSITALSETETFTFVSLGNPHIVSYRNGAEQSDNSSPRNKSNDGKETGETELMQTGLKANAMPSLFPEGVNVTFYAPKGRQAIYTETFERGAGLTQACGTAMSASSIAACIRGLCRYGEWIDVYNKGGMVKCLVENRGDKTAKEPASEPTGGQASNLSIKADPELLTKVGNPIQKISVRLLGNATFEYSAAVDFDNHTAENPGTNPVISVTLETTTAELDANLAEPESTISIPQRANSALPETYLIKSKANPAKTKKNSIPQLGQVYEKTTHSEEIAAYDRFLKTVNK